MTFNLTRRHFVGGALAAQVDLLVADRAHERRAGPELEEGTAVEAGHAARG